MSIDVLFKIILIILVIILAYTLVHYAMPGVARTVRVSGGCGDCAGGVPLSADAREIVALSVRVSGGGNSVRMSLGGAEAVKSGDQNRVAEYLQKAARAYDDATAVELKSLKNDIVNIIRAYPGLVEYVCSIDPVTDNKNISDTIEDIQVAVRKTGGGTLADEVYSLIKPYIREVGNSRSVETFLKSYAGIKTLSAKNIRADIKADKAIKHKALYQIIEDIIDDSPSIGNKEDFIRKTGLRYEHFLPANKRKWLSIAEDLDIDIVPDLRNELRTYLRDNSVRAYTRADLDRILEKMEGSLSIYKFAPGYAKKTKAAITKAKDKAFALDTLAVLPILKGLAESMHNVSRWSSVLELIRDLGSARLLTPEEEAIRRILRALHADAPQETTSLLKDLQREREREAREREFRRAHEAELQRKSEEIARLREEAEQAQMRAVVEESKRTAKEEEAQRAQDEAIAELSRIDVTDDTASEASEASEASAESETRDIGRLEARIREANVRANELERQRAETANNDSTDPEWQRLDREIFALYDEIKNLTRELNNLTQGAADTRERDNIISEYD